MLIRGIRVTEIRGKTRGRRQNKERKAAILKRVFAPKLSLKKAIAAIRPSPKIKRGKEAFKKDDLSNPLMMKKRRKYQGIVSMAASWVLIVFICQGRGPRRTLIKESE